MGIFVTGTDTGIGKTWVTLGVMAALQARGQVVCGMKPIASGAWRRQDGLVNEDALALQAQGNCGQIDLRCINPFVYRPAIAPHLAAAQAGVPISLAKVRSIYKQIAAVSDQVVVEGVGGWRVPLSDTISLVDLVRMLDLSVILVVGVRLGCLNHAILTVEGILADGVELIGWVANCIDPDMECLAENVRALVTRLPVPMLAEVPYLPTQDINQLAARFAHIDFMA